MRQLVVYIACAATCLLPARMVSAQRRHGPSTAPVVTVKATVDKQKIFVGQPIQLMLEASVAGNASLQWPVLDSLPHFEWLKQGSVDSSVQAGGRYYKQYMTLTSFDSGSWAIPRLPFVAGNKKFLSDSVRIEVAYTPFDRNGDFHDIKEIIDVPNPFARWIPWIIGAVTLVALALVVWLVRRRKQLKTVRASSVPVRKLSPYEEAISQLEELERQHLPENGSMKVFYTRLNDILRIYLFRRLGISSLAETSEELIGKLRRLPMPDENREEIAETLRMSDFVKFAKYQPGIADSHHHFTVIRDSVEQLDKTATAAEESERLRRMEAATTGSSGAGTTGTKQTNQ